MYFNSLSAVGYTTNGTATESISVFTNPTSASLENARVGVRFRYHYFDTWNNKVNTTNAGIIGDAEQLTIPNNVLARNYLLSSITDGELLSAKTPTNFFNPDDFTPFTWKVNSEHEHLFLTVNDDEYQMSIWPTQFYPLITKNTLSSFTVTAAVMPATGFSGNVDAYEYRKRIKDNSYNSLVFGNSYFPAVSPTPTSYISKRRVNYNIGSNRNWIRSYYKKSIGKNVIPNSYVLQVPVLTAKVDDLTSDFDGFQLSYSFASVAYPNDATNSTFQILSTLPSEELSDQGINFPYTTNANSRYRADRGTSYLYFNAPFYLEKNEDIIAFYETYDSYSTGITISKIGASNSIYGVSADASLNSGIYFYNYYFPKNRGKEDNDGFTISFMPSSFVISSGLSSANVGTTMVDNFFQTSYDIDVNSTKMIKRIIEENNDYSLSAIHLGNNQTYILNEWMPASGDIKLINNGLGNKYNFKVQLSAFTDAIYEERDYLTVLLNKNNIVLQPIVSENGPMSAYIETFIFPSPDEGFGVKWTAFPPENVVFTNSDGDVIEQDVFYDDLYDVYINYLGVDKTEITLYSAEYESSASTFWYPPSTVANDVFMEVRGSVNDYNETGSITLSALFNRNGRVYRAPENANIIWNELANDERGSLTLRATNPLETIVEEGTVYSSTHEYSNLVAAVSSIPTPSNPKYILFNMSCEMFGDIAGNNYQLNANELFLYREYPSTDLLSISAKAASSPELINSENQKSKVYTSNQSISLSAIYPNLVSNSANILWKITDSNNNVVEATGNTTSFSLNTVSACVGVSALNSKPFEGNFKYYNFEDSICFYNLSSLVAFDYIAFPENQYNPTVNAASFVVDYGICGSGYQTQVFDIYTESNGMSSFKPCHTENFYFSATPGFDKYVWTIGTNITETDSNKAVIPVSYNDVSANNNVYVSAYNTIFLENDPTTIYNSASSDDSNVYREKIRFLDFPAPSATITLSNDLVNVSKYSTIPTLACVIDTENIDINSYTFNVVLSGEALFQYKEISGDKNNFSKLLKINIENSDFIIPENSFNVLNAYLSGNVSVTVGGFDFCAQSYPVSSNIVSLSVFNGPNLELYTATNLVSTGETVRFFNNSNSNFFSTNEEFTSFIFDNGEGTLQTSTSAILETTYLLEGSKSPSITGVLTNGVSAFQTWNNLVYVKNSKEAYDSLVTREFFDNVELPYSLNETKIKPNEWQYASVVNNAFEKLKTNIDYLSASCYVNNIVFPKAYGGYLGEKYGNFKWQTLYDAQNIGPDGFNNMKTCQILDNNIIVCTTSSVQIYTYDEAPQLVTSFTKIDSGEIFENLEKAYYSEDLNRLYVLDSSKNIIMVAQYDINDPTTTALTHYWGGVGGREDRTKLNNPVDFCLDGSNNLYIVDKDSYLIKVYNKNLNWIKNIQLSTFEKDNRPVSISYAFNMFSVTTEDGRSFITNSSFDILTTINETASRSILNPNDEGIVYILDNTVIKKYTVNGVYVAEKDYGVTLLNASFNDDHIFLNGEQIIFKIVDFIQVDQIINDNESLSGFGWDSIYINETEFVTDYIFNDSFQKIHDNITLLNNRINKRLYLQLNETGDTINQYTSSFTPSAITEYPLYIATNEPVLYDTINRGITFLYRNIEDLKSNVDITIQYPNNNNNVQWIWKFHEIDSIQKPSPFKNPVSWKELTTAKIVGNTQLSSFSSWCTTRLGLSGNHSEICWNFEQTQCNSYFHLSWEDTECGNACGYIFTWEDLESNCCEKPDFVFDDSATIC